MPESFEQIPNTYRYVVANPPSNARIHGADDSGNGFDIETEDGKIFAFCQTTDRVIDGYLVLYGTCSEVVNGKWIKCENAKLELTYNQQNRTGVLEFQR